MNHVDLEHSYKEISPKKIQEQEAIKQTRARRKSSISPQENHGFATFFSLCGSRNNDKFKSELEFLRAIPATVTTVDFSHTKLYDNNDKQLHELLKAIPEFIEILDLSHNHLHRKQAHALAKALAAMPGSVKVIDLSFNHFHEKSNHDLAQILESIPQTVTDIKLESHPRYLKKNNLSPRLLPNAITWDKSEIKELIEHLRINEILDKHMGLFREKALKMKDKTSQSLDAIDELHRFIGAIDAAKEQFNQAGCDAFDAAKKALFTACKTHIEEAKGKLGRHRGYLEMLCQFLSALVSCLSIGIMNIATGKSFFNVFSVKTDSMRKLDAFEGEIMVRNSPGQTC